MSAYRSEQCASTYAHAPHYFRVPLRPGEWHADGTRHCPGRAVDSHGQDLAGMAERAREGHARLVEAARVDRLRVWQGPLDRLETMIVEGRVYISLSPEGLNLGRIRASRERMAR